MAVSVPKIGKDSRNTEDEAIVKQIQQFKRDAEASSERMERMRLNEMNRQAFMEKQDFSDKLDGMSQEFLPETWRTCEQFAAFIKKGLVAFDDWFSIDMPKSSPISSESARRLLSCYLDHLPENNQTTTFAERISDGSKVGLLESKICLKIHGHKQEQNFYVEEGDELTTIKLAPWVLRIDLCRSEDIFEDPTGRGLFRIHRVRRDLHEVQKLAEQGVYDKAAVAKIKEDFTKEDQYDRDRFKHIPQTKRKQVIIDEFWGTLLDDDGSVKHANCLATVANEKHLIRKPTPNPNWHGEDPFEIFPIMRVPFSVHHKALYDAVVPLNLALNELFNLILDGGIASVWGVRQVHMDWLEGTDQVAGGIPQGKTLAVNENCPPGQKAVETVTTGSVPGEALAVFNIVGRQLHSAAMQNDITLGNLPARQVKATEVVEAAGSQAVSLDSIIMDMEKHIARTIRKAWLTLMQNADDLLTTAVNEALTPSELFRFARMSPAQRFAAFANNCHFKVSGLSATLQRAKDFQRIMAIMQAGAQNPLIMREMVNRFSAGKMLDRLMRALNLNPRDLEKDEQELAAKGEEMQFLQQFSGNNMSSRPLGEPGVTSEIRQTAEPSNM